MNTDRWPQIEAALDELLDLSAAERGARLARLAEEDPALALELKPFLADEAESTGPLDAPLETFAAAVFDDVPTESAEPGAGAGPHKPGTAIGPYRVVREIGHGGMGSVLLGERTDGGFEQRVAIKVVRGSHPEIAERFRHERQILARLRHPNIASLFGGGSTDSGEPYFAMEYIDGERITDYCDRERLDIEARIELFEDVCRAVQYAHRNLVVHRDLKPGNVFVTKDGAVKLLDFGIAKVLESEGDAQGTTRQFLTPAYAAPEQVLGEPTSTATDIYSLGVLLYELLTGRNPHGDTARSVEMARNVVERHPPSASATVGPDLAAARSADPGSLRRRLRGDIDNILQLALRKAPEERYPSAEALRADLERHRRKLPVSARPATVRYRIGRFVRRHRIGTAAIAAVLVTAIAGFTGVAWQAGVASRERDAARIAATRAEAVKDYLLDVFGAADPGADDGATLTAVELAERGAEQLGSQFEDAPDIRADVTNTLGHVFLRLAEYERAEELLKLAIEQYRTAGRTEELIDSLVLLSDVYQSQRRVEEAAVLLDEAVPLAEASLPEDHPQALLARIALGIVRNWQGRYDEAEEIFRDALAVARRTPGAGNELVPDPLANLATAQVTNGRPMEAQAALAEAVALYREAGADALALAQTLSSLADVEKRLDHPERAEPMAAEAAAILREEFGPEGHPHLAIALTNHANILRRLGRFAEAEELQREVIAMFIVHLGPDHGYVGRAHNNLGVTLKESGDIEGAEREYREAVRLCKGSFGERHPSLVSELGNHADALSTLGRNEEAERIFREAISIAEEAHTDGLGKSYPLLGLARICRETGRLEESERLTRESWELREAALGPGHSAELEARIELASVVAARGRPEEARRLLDSAIEDSRGDGKVARRRLDRALEARATVARDAGEPREELAALLQELLELRREDLDPGDERIVAVERELGTLRGT